MCLHVNERRKMIFGPSRALSRVRFQIQFNSIIAPSQPSPLSPLRLSEKENILTMLCKREQEVSSEMSMPELIYGQKLLTIIKKRNGCHKMNNGYRLLTKICGISKGFFRFFFVILTNLKKNLINKFLWRKTALTEAKKPFFSVEGKINQALPHAMSFCTLWEIETVERKKQKFIKKIHRKNLKNIKIQFLNKKFSFPAYP